MAGWGLHFRRTDGWHIVREGAAMGEWHSSAQMAQGNCHHAVLWCFLSGIPLCLEHLKHTMKKKNK